MPVRTIITTATMLLLVGTTQARAQQRVELQPFAGVRFGGSFTVDEPIPGGTRPVDLSADSGLAWGATVGVLLGPSVGLEFLWSRQESGITAAALDIAETKLFDAAISQYHGNVLFHFLEPDRPVRPYILLGLGATNIDPDADVEGLTKFSFALGAGIKAYFNEHVGIRLQGRYTPTYITSTPAVFCDVFGFCYATEAANYANQGEFTAGVTIKF